MRGMDPPRLRGPWPAYAGLCLVAWMLYGMAGTEWQRGGWRVLEAAWEASWTLWAPMALGIAVWPWVRRIQGRRWAAPAHVAGALVFAAAWLALDFAAAWGFFGIGHAQASFEQRVLWRALWGVFVYGALALGFEAVLHARRAQASALAAAQSDAARVRAELAAIGGQLNPHFLFNTLNSIVALTRKDPAAAERALLRFARLMRYVLDSQRAGAARVALGAEIEFVRDYLALEALRLGPRLAVDWAVDEAALDEDVPPLTLQPLVENAIRHGIAPRVQGGTVRIEAARRGETLALAVADDGGGCEWPAARTGVGLAALQQRFALDYAGRAHFDVRTAPGAGFRVQITLPFDA